MRWILLFQLTKQTVIAGFDVLSSQGSVRQAAILLLCMDMFLPSENCVLVFAKSLVFGLQSRCDQIVHPCDFLKVVGSFFPGFESFCPFPLQALSGAWPHPLAPCATLLISSVLKLKDFLISSSSTSIVLPLCFFCHVLFSSSASWNYIIIAFHRTPECACCKAAEVCKQAAGPNISTHAHKSQLHVCVFVAAHHPTCCRREPKFIERLRLKSRKRDVIIQ